MVVTILFVLVIAVGSEVATILFSACFTILCTFGIGFLAGDTYISTVPAPYTLYEKNGDVHRGMLVVGGERGILFFDSNTKKSEFLKWEDVGRIEREKVFSGI